MDMPVLSVESVSKKYWIQQDRPLTLKESMIRRLRGGYGKRKALWALRDVTFSVEKGCSLGIIGHNGAGKSTLLRLICGLGCPTSGRIRREGQLGNLLELGTGFHPDMTGRENLLTGGILNGLSKDRVKAREEEIISFAELEEFIDQPVRTYSTGMYLRLAFSTAIHFDPDFLVIDEVLAVGDARFQQKCRERLDGFRKAGKTLILTSHDLEQIRSLCDEVLVMEEGQLVTRRDPEAAIQCYHDLIRQRTEKRLGEMGKEKVLPGLEVSQGSRLGTQEATLRAVHLYDGRARPLESLSSGDSLMIELEYSVSKPLHDMALILGIYSETNLKCFEVNINSVNTTLESFPNQGRIRCQIPEVPLLPGRYYINVGLYPTNWDYIYDYHWQMHSFHVLDGRGSPPQASGFVLMRPVWSAGKRQ
jgi:lipopolysaccharide transport system ATP-binding protein